jgi:hypothetical protein
MLPGTQRLPPSKSSIKVAVALTGWAVGAGEGVALPKGPLGLAVGVAVKVGDIVVVPGTALADWVGVGVTVALDVQLWVMLGVAVGVAVKVGDGVLLAKALAVVVAVLVGDMVLVPSTGVTVRVHVGVAVGVQVAVPAAWAPRGQANKAAIKKDCAFMADPPPLGCHPFRPREGRIISPVGK